MKILVKKEDINSEFGINPFERPVEELINYGIINLNKPVGPTSHQATDYVKKILNVSKAGHSGTLDPGVNGVLPIATERATRIVQYLLKSGKEYVCLMYVHKPVDKEKIIKTFEEFKGKIKQLPPLRSAVKRVERERSIYFIDILEIDKQYVLFKVGCEAGTYIRKLVHDFGLKIGTGAHMKQLVRTKVGPFTDENWHSLHDLKDAYEFYKQGDETEIKKIVLPMEKAVENIPKIWVFDTTITPLIHGTDLYAPGIAKLNDNINAGDNVAVMTLKDELICMAQAKMDSKTILSSDKGIAAKTKKVFMKISQ